MYYPIILFISLFFLNFKTARKGCPQDIWVQTSNGVNINSAYRAFNHCDSVFITSDDSVSLFVKGGNCCTLKIIRITLNGSDVPFILKGPQGNCFNLETRIAAKPGYYEVDASLNSQSHHVSFDMISNPLGLKITGITDSQVKVFPNPSYNEVNVYCDGSILSSIDIYSDQGEKLRRFETNSDKIKISLQDLLAGIYYLRITLIDERIVIKKITVL